MSDESFAAPTSSHPGSSMTPASEEDYDAICAAVMETVRGRWFLSEYSRRNRHADTQLVLAALDRIESGLRGQQTPQSIERLRHDLMEMAKAIALAKNEIAGVAPDGEGDPIGDVSLELDSVVRATDEATSNILAAAAQIQEVAWTMREQGKDARLCDQLDTYATNIQTAASSQKLTGQRTQKVVHVMRDLEGRINDMIDVWGGYPAVDNRVLANAARNTPALPPADVVQAAIDTTTDTEPSENSYDQPDANLRDSQLIASPEASRQTGPSHLNDNGRVMPSNGHVVLDPRIEAAIQDAAAITNAVEPETTKTESAEITGSLPTPTEAHEASGDDKDPGPSEPSAMQDLRDLQGLDDLDDSDDLEEVAASGAPKSSSEPVVTETGSLRRTPHSEPTSLLVSADRDGETDPLRREPASAPLAVLSEPTFHSEPAKGGATDAMTAPALDSVIVISDHETATVELTTSFAASSPRASAGLTQSSLSLELASESQTIVASAPNANGRAPAQAVVAAAAELDQQPEPLIEMQLDAQETRDTEGASVIELRARPRPFVVIDLELEPLSTGLDNQVSPGPEADSKANATALDVEPAAGLAGSREIAALQTAEPAPLGWLSEPDTTLHDVPAREVSAKTVSQLSAVTAAVTRSDAAPEALQARPSQPDLPSPVVFVPAEPVLEPSEEPPAVVVPRAAPEPSGPAAAAASAPAKPTAPSANAKLRPSPPPPVDPLAAIAALSEEEKIALFS